VGPLPGSFSCLTPAVSSIAEPAWFLSATVLVLLFRSLLLTPTHGLHKLGPELPLLAPGKPPVETGGSATPLVL